MSDAFVDEMVGVFTSYIGALDAGDIELAYSFVVGSLRAEEGWDEESFTTFWTESVVGATVVSIDDARPWTGEVLATVDYALPDGTTSREDVTAVLQPAGDGGLLHLFDYEVRATEILDGAE